VNYRIRRIAAGGLLAALALAVNFPLLGVPNVELFSVCLFISGIYLGFWGGFMVPFAAGMIFIIFNPNGPPSLLTVALAQLMGFVLFGMVGAVFGRSIIRNKNRVVGMTFLAAIGIVFTFIYDLLTNLAFALSVGPFKPVLIAGLAFSLWHMVSNGLIFGLSEPIIVKLWHVAGPRLSQSP
jgi:hypothetical protein